MPKNKIILILIILFAILLRIYNLGATNLGFFRDEAALGYSSWSILKTGADEFGKSFPIVFRSFEVFFMPAYVYLSVPIFFIFGETEFSTRLLSALAGIIITYLSYLIAKKIFKTESTALIASFVVATSPWAVFYSRGAFEGNLSLMFFAMGFYWWIKFLEDRKRNDFLISVLWFVLSMYSYQAPRFVVPLFICLSVLTQNKWYKNIKLWFIGAVFALVLYMPVALISLSPASYHRAAGVSIFKTGNFTNSLPVELLSLYASYYSPSNLFWNGDYNLQRHIPNFSVFYVFLLPFFIVGVWNVFKNKKLFNNLIIWFLIAPIPAALTTDPFHTYRSILFWLPVSLIISNGIYHVYVKLKSVLFIYSYILITLIFIVYFMFSFFNIAPVLYSKEWDYGYKEVSEYIKKQPDTYRVLIDDQRTESYIHLLFYNNINIHIYQDIASKLLGDKYYSSSEELRPIQVGRFEFRPVDWPSERGDRNTIFVFPSDRLQPSEFSSDPKLLWEKTIYSPDGKDAFYIIKSN